MMQYNPFPSPGTLHQLEIQAHHQVLRADPSAGPQQLTASTAAVGMPTWGSVPTLQNSCCLLPLSFFNASKSHPPPFSQTLKAIDTFSSAIQICVGFPSQGKG